MNTSAAATIDHDELYYRFAERAVGLAPRAVLPMARVMVESSWTVARRTQRDRAAHSWFLRQHWDQAVFRVSIGQT